MWDTAYLINFLKHSFVETKHYAIFLPHKSLDLETRIVYGANYPNPSKKLPSIHAEHCALKKLVRKKNRPKYVDLVAVRLSKSGKLGESRPCFHCMLRLIQESKNIGVTICKVYYSTIDGNIVCIPFTTLKHLEANVMNGYRLHNWKLCL